jgi:hypothetical protein
MKKQILKAIGGASLAILMLAGFAQVWVSAQDKSSSEPVKNEGQNGNEQGLVGSWNLQATLRDCNSGFPFVTFAAMNTYNQGGTTQQTAVPEPGGPTALAGHGVWNHQTGRSYSGAFQFFSLNPDGTYAGRVIVRSAIRLGRGGNSYTSTDTGEIFNANGDLLFRACSTTTATRFE